MKSTTSITTLCILGAALLCCSAAAAPSALRGGGDRRLFLDNPAGSHWKEQCVSDCKSNCFGDFRCVDRCTAEHKCAKKPTCGGYIVPEWQAWLGTVVDPESRHEYVEKKGGGNVRCYVRKAKLRRLIVNHPWDSTTCTQCTGDCRGNCIGGMIADYSLQALIEIGKAMGKNKARGRGLGEGVDPWLEVLAGQGSAIDRNAKCFAKCMAEHCTYNGNSRRMLHEEDAATQAAAVDALKEAAEAALAEAEGGAAPAAHARKLWGLNDPAGDANQFRCRRSCDGNCHGNEECTKKCFREHCTNKPKCHRVNPCGDPQEQTLLQALQSGDLHKTIRVQTQMIHSRTC